MARIEDQHANEISDAELDGVVGGTASATKQPKSMDPSKTDQQDPHPKDDPITTKEAAMLAEQQGMYSKQDMAAAKEAAMNAAHKGSSSAADLIAAANEMKSQAEGSLTSGATSNAGLLTKHK